MSNTQIRIDAVPEIAQAVALEAKTDLVGRLDADPDTVAITKLERVERLEEEEMPAYERFGKSATSDYRIFLLAKGTQYVYETRQGKSPTLMEERFVV